jgi:diaminohydroxyphosphoribosylaminopyrimidine deaminase/5-amino-6-(5-phosphoribosylamino)uracil reductase
VLTSGAAPEGWTRLADPAGISGLEDVNFLLVEGGARTAAAFIRADLVDRLLVYRAPVVIGDGLGAIADLGLGQLADAHGQWRRVSTRPLGTDQLEVYERTR